MVSGLEPYFASTRFADISGGNALGWRGPLLKLVKSAQAWSSLRGSDVVYIAVKAGRGMWLTTATALLARFVRADIFLHHHSYAYVRERKSRMVALTCAAGPDARHIVLSPLMATDLTRVMPEISRPLVVGNAGLVDSKLLELPIKVGGGELVLGHLSNLSLDKGIAEVVDLACELQGARNRTRLIVAGPILDDESRFHLSRAAMRLGERFEYRGKLFGDDKLKFFSDITHFVFPSGYVHEAVPLVLYEAMAAGVVCIATPQGAITEQLEGSPGIIARASTFVEDALQALGHQTVSSAESRACRQAYLQALNSSVEQLVQLIAEMSGR